MSEPTRRFDLLLARYLASLPSKREALVRAWRAFADAPDDRTRGELHVLVHRLAGSAPVYGRERLGEAARAADAQFAEPERGASPAERGRDLAARLEQPIRALLDCLESEAAQTGDAEVAARAGQALRIILVADDAADVRAALEAGGCLVRVETVPDRVGDALIVWPCHAVVVDLRVGDEAAAEIAARVRSDPTHARVALVGLGPGEALAECDARVGADAPERLLATLRSSVARRNMR